MSTWKGNSSRSVPVSLESLDDDDSADAENGTVLEDDGVGLIGGPS
jgi:hypothetical protein